MALIIKNLLITDAKVSIEVCDLMNYGNEGQLKLYIGNELKNEKDIVLNRDFKTESFSLSPNDHGITYRVVAKSGNQKSEIRQMKV